MSKGVYYLKIDGGNPVPVYRGEIEAAVNYYNPPHPLQMEKHLSTLLGCARALLETETFTPIGATGASTMVTHTDDKPDPNPEITLAKLMGDDLGVAISPQALRLFIRWRWDQVRRLAHLIHGSTTP